MGVELGVDDRNGKFETGIGDVELARVTSG